MPRRATGSSGQGRRDIVRPDRPGPRPGSRESPRRVSLSRAYGPRGHDIRRRSPPRGLRQNRAGRLPCREAAATGKAYRSEDSAARLRSDRGRWIHKLRQEPGKVAPRRPDEGGACGRPLALAAGPRPRRGKPGGRQGRLAPRADARPAPEGVQGAPPEAPLSPPPPGRPVPVPDRLDEGARSSPPSGGEAARCAFGRTDSAETLRPTHRHRR